MNKTQEAFTQFGNPAYVEREPQPPGVVYVFMQFGDQYIKAFRNSILARVRILSNYHGRCLGLAKQVDVVEGFWKGDRAMAVFEFDTHFNAGMWLSSDSDVSQGDFLNGCDVIIASTMSRIPLNRNLFQLMDVKIHDVQTFMDQYVAGHLPDMEGAGGFNAIATDKYVCHRGSFTPSFLVVHQWESYQAFYDWYKSCDYNSKWKPYRLHTAETNMILFHLEPL